MTTTKQSNLCRLLLAHLRNGDFTHPGEEEAIGIVIDYLKMLNPDWKGKRALDAGSGLGGTAAIMNKKLLCEVHGIDLDENAINYAKAKYSKLHFATGDILEVDKIYGNDSFQLIYLFNVLYAIKEKSKVLSSLAKIASKNAVLVIFDYTVPTKTSLDILDFAGNEMLPIINDETLEKTLLATGWLLIHEVDLTNKYIEWYSDLLKKIENNRESLMEKFTKPAYESVQNTLSQLLKNLQKKELGGYIFYAQKHSSELLTM